MSAHRVLGQFLLILGFWLIFPHSASRTSILYLEQLLLPGTPLKILRSGSRHSVCVQLSSRPATEVLQHFLSLSQQRGWKLDFPSAEEAKIWLTALQSSENPPVLMLGLSESSQPLYAVITIGVVKATRATEKKTIITLDLAPTAFGRLRR
jgi:hypothetical protein